MLKWYGKQVVAQFNAGIPPGIDKTMSQAAIYAKNNHRGWSNRTGKAEGSITVIERAKAIGQRIVGYWGSVNVVYMLWLEIKHGSALRTSASVNYKNLARNIRDSLKLRGF